MNPILFRHTFRAAQPLRCQGRRYASTSSDPTNKIVLLLIGGGIGAGIGYYWKETRNSGTVPKPSVTAAVSAPPKPAFTGGDQGFFGLKLDSVKELSHNTKKFRFALPDADSVSGLQVASALLTKYKGPEMEKPVIRPYTPVTDVDQKGFLDLVVKKYPNGPMSEHMHSMTPGQQLDFKGPIPKYPWEPNKHDHVAMIAGGTGITPMYQVAKAIFSNPADKTKVTLIFGNLTEEDILLKRELEDLENTYPQRFRSFYLLDKPPEKWQGGTGHVNKDLLKTVLPGASDTTGGDDTQKGKGKEDLKIFVCGPPGLYKAVSGTKNSPTDQGELTGLLKELNYKPEQVYKF